MKTFIWAIVISLITSFHALANEEIVIHAGRLIDTAEGEVLTKQTIYVENGKITGLAKGYMQAKKDATVIDLKNSTVMPGLMDMHTHLCVELGPKTYIEEFTLNATDFTIRAVKHAERTVMAGFTTVRDLGDSDNITISLKKAILSGLIIGPTIYTSTLPIATTGGHGDPTNGRSWKNMIDVGPEHGVVNGVAEARAAVRQRYKEGADLIKITATGGVLSVAKSGQNPQFFQDELNAIVATAKDYGFTVAVHAHGKEGIRRAIIAGVDSIEHGTYMDNEIFRLMKKHGVYYVPTILAGNWVAEKAKIPGFFPELVRPKAAAIGPKIKSTFRSAYEAGVKIAFGSDTGVSAHGDNWQELVLMTEAGMPAMEVLQSATVEAAKLLKIEKQVGSIRKGMTADIIAVAGNPLKDMKVMSNVSFVMSRGKVIKNIQ